jgi:hypothetical protein
VAESNVEKVATLKDKLIKTLLETGAKFPIPNPEYEAPR